MLKGYINGTEVARSSNFVFQGDNTAPFIIGASGTCGDHFPGLIDEFTVYRRALTPQEVAILAAPGAPTGFVAPPGDFSTLTQQNDGTFVRRFKDGTEVHFAADGLHTSTVDRNGNTTTYTYDMQGRLLTITDPRGLVTTLRYGAGSLLSSVTDPAGRVTTFAHDPAGNLTQITYPDGSSESFTYDARHLLTEDTNQRGFTTHYEYDFAGRYVRTTEPDGSTRAMTASQLVGLVDTSGGTGTSPAQPAPVRRPAQAVGSFVDGRANASTLKTDALGALTHQVDPLGRVTDIVRNSHSQPTQITRPNGAIVAMTYDTRGNLLTSMEQAISATTAFTYEPTFNQVTSITDPLTNRTTLTYDAHGNPLEILDANGTRTALLYADAHCPGQPTSVTSAAGLPEDNTTTLAYDATTCNLIQTTDPLGRPTSLQYDAAGNVSQSCDAEGRRTRFRYDVMNRLLKVLDATTAALDATCAPVAGPEPSCPTVGVGVPGVTCYTYDARGNLTVVIDARGSLTAFEYDALDRLQARVDPLGQRETFAYDSNSNLLSTTDRQGQTIAFQYDAVNQLTQKTWLPGTPQAAITALTYDTVGNLTAVQDPDSALTMTYDLLNRLTQVSTVASPSQPGVQITYTYDKNGNRLTMEDPKGQTSYTYDVLNRLTRLINPAGQAVTFAYDALSRRTQTTLPNGTTSTLAYDAASQLLSLAHQRTGSPNPFSTFAYSYDRVGNRTRLDQQRATVAVNPALTYLYDPLDRLVEATRPLPADPLETFQYDPVGNRLQRDGQSAPARFNAANRLLEDTDLCYSYDANGNLTSKEAKVGGVCNGAGTVTAYKYDPENQLIAVRVNGTVVASYRYDGLGRRIEKNANGQITRYIYDNEDILLETGAAGTIQARYTHGPGIDEPVIMEHDLNANGSFEANERFFYHADGLGSVTELTDSPGAVFQDYVYDSYGEIASQTKLLSNLYTYTGREFDPESGLYYYRARYYDSNAGRFLQEDSLGKRWEKSAYAYVGNNPLTFVDPSGFARIFIWYTGEGPGHASLLLDDGTYISFYPKSDRKDHSGGVPGVFHNWKDDFRKSGSPDETVEVQGMNETAIKRWFENTKTRVPNYNLL